MKLTWILVADNARARFFTAESPASALEEMEGLVHPEGRLHDRDMTEDLPGRIKSPGAIGHAFEQETDPKRHEEEHFAKQVAHYLLDAHNAHKFEQLLIIADPTFLGLLRHQLPEHVKKQVCFELAKNITTEGVADIRKHLPDFLPNH
ncbi:MAG: host attachment protein [Methylococcales bacterium]|nr:host attachment protein [Methylococcales bacterium]